MCLMCVCVSQLSSKHAVRLQEWRDLITRMSDDGIIVRDLQQFYKRGKWEPSVSAAREALTKEMQVRLIVVDE